MKKVVLVLLALFMLVLFFSCDFSTPEDIDHTYEDVFNRVQAYVDQHGEQDGKAVQYVAEQMLAHGYRDECITVGDVEQVDRELKEWWRQNSSGTMPIYPQYCYAVAQFSDPPKKYRWEIYVYYTWDNDRFQEFLYVYATPDRQYLTELGDGWWLYAEDLYAGKK